MAKSQTQAATQSAKDIAAQARKATTPITEGMETQFRADQGPATEQMYSAMGGYGDEMTTGGYDPAVAAGLRSSTGDIATTGGYDPTKLLDLQGRMIGTSTTGGYDPALLQKIVSGAGATYDPTSLATIRGGYTDFAKTGGFAPTDISNYLNTATAGVRGAYDVLGGQAADVASKTGGMGGASALARMARQGASAASEADIAAQAGLTSQINANKMAGLGGLQGTESDVARLAQSGAGILGTTAGTQASNILRSQGQEASLMGDVAGGRRTGVNQQLNLESDIAAGKRAGTQGMANLYGTTGGFAHQDITDALKSMGLDFSTEQAANDSMVKLSQNPGMFQTVLGGITQLAGAASGLAGAFPALGKIGM
jgi:hypothetical protein